MVFKKIIFQNSLMAKFPDIFLPHFFSFAIESYIYETDFTLMILNGFLKKSFFKIGMWHSRPPRDPPPLLGKCHLKFPF